MRYLTINNDSTLAGGATQSERDSSSSSCFAIATEIAAQLACDYQIYGIGIGKNKYLLHTCDIIGTVKGAPCPKFLGKFTELYYAIHKGDVSELERIYYLLASSTFAFVSFPLLALHAAYDTKRSFLLVLKAATAAAYKNVIVAYAVDEQPPRGIFTELRSPQVDALWRHLWGHPVFE